MGCRNPVSPRVPAQGGFRSFLSQSASPESDLITLVFRFFLVLGLDLGFYGLSDVRLLCRNVINPMCGHTCREHWPSIISVWDRLRWCGLGWRYGYSCPHIFLDSFEPHHDVPGTGSTGINHRYFHSRSGGNRLPVSLDVTCSIRTCCKQEVHERMAGVVSGVVYGGASRGGAGRRAGERVAAF